MREVRIEIVIRKKHIEGIPKRFEQVVKEFRQFESDDRLVLDVPQTWQGWKDGTIIDLLKEFGESMYVALAYFTMDDSETVTDFNGNSVDRYEVSYDGKRLQKYVKKRLRIARVLNASDGTFEVKGYVLDLKLMDPVVKVLDVYSVGTVSGLQLEQFVR